ncbi:hypothetical protein ACF0H5_016116 [Mactra antiquata]
MRMQHHKALGLTFILIFKSLYVSAEEPNCCSKVFRCSKYDFEEKVLEKLIRLEHRFELLKQDFTQSLSEMKTTKTDMEQYITNIDETLAAVKETVNITSLEIRINKTLNEQLEDLDMWKGRLSHPTIMFKARQLAKSMFEQDETLIFTNAFSEHGNGYNPDSGIFTVPVSGMYWFQVTLCLESAGCIVGILVDGEKILVENIYDNSGGDHGGNSCFSYSTVHLLSAGQSVVVKALSGYSKCNIHQSEAHRWNTFYGLLLQG